MGDKYLSIWSSLFHLLKYTTPSEALKGLFCFFSADIQNSPCIRSLAKFPASQAKAGQARLSGFLARLTRKMRPGKAQQAWPQPSFLGNLGHQSSAFVALFVLRPGFLGNLGQKKLGLPGLQDLSQDWPGFCGIPGLKGITKPPGIFGHIVP